jgi:hypothetical protein
VDDALTRNYALTTPSLIIRLSSALSHRIAPHFDAVGVVNQAAENAIRQRRIADLFMPAQDRQLPVKSIGRYVVDEVPCQHARA